MTSSPRLAGRKSYRFALKVGNGSWLCKNAKMLNRDRRSYSSKTVLVAQRASGFNLEIELKNIIPRRVSIFEFLHSQGQRLTSPALDSSIRLRARSGLRRRIAERSAMDQEQK